MSKDDSPLHETEHIPCAKCGVLIRTKWTTNGLHRTDKEEPFVLIADWIYHPECWDKLVKDNPP